MKRTTALITALFTLALMGFATDDIRHDMVRLDKTYIAALSLTSQGKALESRKAVDALQKAWREFHGRHVNANSRDAQWKSDFERVTGMVDEASRIIASDRKPTEAHEALEHVRDVLMKLRERNRIDYFIDELTAFHEPMEGIVLAAKDKTGDTLAAADIEHIRHLLPQAEKAWLGVSAAKLDPQDYLLTPAQADDARKLMELEQTSLAALKAALAIKPNFDKLFMTFGDFRPYAKTGA